MKRIYLLIMVVLFLGQSNCKSNNKSSESSEENITTDSLTVERDVSYDDSLDDSLDEIIEPSEELINKFSPDDLERLIGHEQVLTIGDCFVLLPDKVCMNTSATERRAMQVEGYTPEISYNAVLHEMNQQYLRMGPVFEGEWEMYAVEERDQLWHIAVTMKDCGPVCVETVYEFVYDNGALYQRKPAQLTAFQSITPDMFINFDLLSKEEADSIIDDWQEMTPPEGYPSCILHQLPKEGSEILMYLETMLFDTEIPDKALIEVRGTFPPSGH